MRFIVFLVSIAVGVSIAQCQECPDSYFKCGSGECIPAEYICEGYNDCEDGSDEPDPETGKCPPCPTNTHFQCSNNRCIYTESTCNDFNDCDDWSDEIEELCPCGSLEFRCGKLPHEHPLKPGLCIPVELVCDEDGIWDCADGSDETNCTVKL